MWVGVKQGRRHRIGTPVTSVTQRASTCLHEALSPDAYIKWNSKYRQKFLPNYKRDIDVEKNCCKFCGRGGGGHLSVSFAKHQRPFCFCGHCLEKQALIPSVLTCFYHIAPLGSGVSVLSWVSFLCCPPKIALFYLFCLCFLISAFWMASLYNPSCLGIHCSGQDGLNFTDIHLPLPSQCWDCVKHVPLGLDDNFMFNTHDTINACSG